MGKVSSHYSRHITIDKRMMFYSEACCPIFKSTFFGFVTGLHVSFGCTLHGRAKNSGLSIVCALECESCEHDQCV